jgi:hypothetical protein
MAEVLAVLEVAGCITEIVQGLYDYISAVKSAKDDILKLTQELFALKGALEHFDVQDGRAAAPQASQPLAAEVQGMLRMTRETLDAIQKKLGLGTASLPRGKGTSSKINRAVSALAWPFKSGDIDRYLITLERAKTWFIMVLMRDSTETMGSIYAEVQELSKAVHEDIISKKAEQMQQELDTIIKWLSPVNTSEELAKASISRVPGTGQWIWDQTFSDWAQSPKSTRAFIWIAGKCKS